jgi:dipeptidyl aminopeptidase/acylaminoacyl peptidase
MTPRILSISAAALCLLGAATLAGQAPGGAKPAPQADAAPFRLTVDAVMEGPKLVGYPPSGLRWSGDSQRLFFEWRLRDDDEAATWVVPRAGGQPRRLTDEERKSAPPVSGDWNDAHTRVVTVQDGDIVLLDTVAQTRRALTRTTAGESNPRWAKGEKAVTFTRDNSLFLLSLTADGDGLVQLTDAGPKKPEPKLTDSQKFVKEEEEKLLAVVKEEADKQKKDEEKRKRDELPRIELTERQSVSDLALAHGDAFAYALVVDRAQGAKRAEVPNYVSLSGYTEDIASRTKVGDAQDQRRLAILNLKTKKPVWATLDVPASARPKPDTTEPKAQDMAPEGAQDAAPGGPSASDASAQDAAKTGKGDKPADKPTRDVRWSMPSISPDGTHAVAVVRAADNKDRWLVAIDPETGQTRVLDHLHDDAWIRDAGGFGGGANSGWLPDSTQFWFLSERDGWMHLYIVDAVHTGVAPPRQLTDGKWELQSVDLSPDKKNFYLTSTEAHPGERQLYVMPVQGGARAKVTTLVGAWNSEVSPDGQMIGAVYSASTKPPEVYLLSNQPGAKATQVTTSTSAAWQSYKWIEPQLVTFAARDGAQVYARLYTPEMVGAKRHPSAPGVVFVHGAGYLQNAHKYWSQYSREYMFHHVLASRGYVVLDVDYRGSAGYGRDWRTGIYRHMGGKDLEDIVDGAGYLAKAQKVNAKRIGLYGGSYGGFITLMAMFTTPDAFAAGAALRPVTDWAHYNHPYTANILNEPQDDAEAYRRSSPIYFAEGLKGALLICHGMVDTNVHFQDSVRLAQRLIELRKENWEIAPYPVEDHGFEKATSWADEYKRILKLFDDSLKGKA